MAPRTRQLIFCVALNTCFSCTALSQTFAPGDIFTSLLGENEGPTIQKIDPATGDRVTISGNGVGVGTAIQYPLDIAYSESSGIFVSDRDLVAILRVDPETGNRSIVSGAGTGNGPALMTGPEDIISLALDSDGSILATLPPTQSIVRINPQTGDRVVVASPSVGNGPDFSLLTDIEFTRDGRLLAVDQTQKVIYQVDPASGDRVVFSGQGKGTGAAFINPTRLDVGADNEIVVADWGGKLVNVNPASGARSTITSASLLETLVDIEVGVGDQLVTTHPFNKQIYETDFETGETNILSATPDFGLTLERGDGPDLNYAVLLESVPEVDTTSYDVVSLEAQLDAQWACSFGTCRAEDGDLAVRMFNTIGFDERGAIEFGLDSIAEGAKVKSASLVLQIRGSGFNSLGEISELVLHGYRADDELSQEDAQPSGNIIGGSLTNARQQQPILLDTAFVQELLDTDGDLGILLLPGDNSQSTSFSALEFVQQFPDFPDTIAPTLVLELEDAAGQLVGDFDDSGRVDATDIGFLCGALGATSSTADLNGDGSVTLGDLAALLSESQILPGDTDLSGSVTFADFLVLSADFGAEGDWSTGDFDCSGTVAFADFLQLSENFGKSAVASVPEPTMSPLAWLLLLLIAQRHGIKKAVQHRF